MSTAYAAVFEAIDTCIAEGRCTACAEAEVQRMLAQLRASNGDHEAVVRLEQMSLALNALAAADRAASAADRHAALIRLQALAHDWMHRLPMH